ncbi:SDR family NAD(P)-dependent oxidoreductase [Flagellimonas algicola]|uniref:SDR family NAD(P)-dependent oxidoreductase n=1 Tax=Flagellimonas algicola TaxID=2583815 RepID=A0ABY2WQM2_9FLAO|nr:SDR family NAD(P)-dependent oxidoreductase [Allomuricauda algicola]TMU57302.1 SDR family NAD(P)-dependent oxidoreductase [Allomuricauda algicola]
MKGKNAFSQSILITGANRGMGLGYVRHYLKEGKSIIAAVRTIEKQTELDRLREQHADRLLILRLDVSNEASLVGFTKELKMVQPSFRIVINNAGISMEEKFEAWTMATFEKHFRINTIGPALTSQAIAPFMAKGGKLIQISSGMGSLSWNINPLNHFDAYAASKCALHSITIRLAEKLKAKEIGVFAINPGWVRTEMGGDDATTSIEEAVTDITSTIAQLKFRQTGSFLSEKGEIIPW